MRVGALAGAVAATAAVALTFSAWLALNRWPMLTAGELRILVGMALAPSALAVTMVWFVANRSKRISYPGAVALVLASGAAAWLLTWALVIRLSMRLAQLSGTEQVVNNPLQFLFASEYLWTPLLPLAVIGFWRVGATRREASSARTAGRGHP